MSGQGRVHKWKGGHITHINELLNYLMKYYKLMWEGDVRLRRGD